MCVVLCTLRYLSSFWFYKNGHFQPERIDPQRARGYDVRSDVWSLGITLMEVATGHFPYPKWNSVFEQLFQVVQGDPPRLSPNENGNHFSTEFVNFVNTWWVFQNINIFQSLVAHMSCFLSQEKSKELDSSCDSASKNMNCYHFCYPNFQFLEVNFVESQ